MRLLDPNEMLMNMGHCIVCGQGIDLHVQTITVDTLYDSDLPPMDIMGGRKYICQSCVFDVARTCGFARATEVNELKTILDAFKTEYVQNMDSIRQSIVGALDSAAKAPAVPLLDYILVPKAVADAEEKAKPKRAPKSKETPF